MKPGDKIRLVKGLAERLSQEEWNHLDLTLRQFGLPWSNTWNGNDKYTYALQHLEHGKTEDLLALYEHLFDGSTFLGVTKASKSEGPWSANSFRLFLSHRASDKKFVTEVKNELSVFAIDSFVAHKDIKPTKEWVTEIELALETCDSLAAFLTGKFHASEWTDQEIGYCLKRRVLILPIQMGVDPYGFLSRYQGLQADKLTATDIAEKIFEIVVSHDLTAPHLARALAGQFSESFSFKAAKRNATLLEKVKVWTPELLRSLENTLDTNSQTAGAFGVPETIRRIVKKHGK